MAKRKKRKGAALPSVTLLAYSRTDLLRFSTAVEQLVAVAADLKAYTEKLPKPRAKKPAAPAPAPLTSGQLFDPSEIDGPVTVPLNGFGTS